MDPDQLDGLAQLDELGPQPQAEPAFLPHPQAEDEGPQPQAEPAFLLPQPQAEGEGPQPQADDAAARAIQTATITAMTFMVATIKTQNSSLEYIRNFTPQHQHFGICIYALGCVVQGQRKVK